MIGTKSCGDLKNLKIMTCMNNLYTGIDIKFKKPMKASDLEKIRNITAKIWKTDLISSIKFDTIKSKPPTTFSLTGKKLITGGFFKGDKDGR